MSPSVRFVFVFNEVTGNFVFRTYVMLISIAEYILNHFQVHMPFRDELSTPGRSETKKFAHASLQCAGGGAAHPWRPNTSESSSGECPWEAKKLCCETYGTVKGGGVVVWVGV